MCIYIHIYIHTHIYISFSSRPYPRMGRWVGGSGWGIHVNPWLIHANVWQKPLQYCKVISLQLIKINGKKRKNLNNILLNTL